MPRARNSTLPNSRTFRSEAGQRLKYLPAGGCELPVPPMPSGRVWSEDERARWDELWKSPQASQWDDSVRGTVGLLVAYESTLLAGDGTAWVAQEARYASDALGLTPKAMTSLGWVIDDAE